ncbi:MAG: tetratricopeptide repeat protein, partial [Vicingaceae bacterium]
TLSDYKNSIKHNEIALSNYRKIADSASVAAIHNNISNVYLKLGNYVKALEHSFDALKIYDKIDQFRNKAMVLENIANIYYELDELKQSEEYYNKTLPLYQKHAGDLDVARCYGNFARVFLKQNQDDSSITYLEKAIQINKKGNAKVSLLINYTNLGNVYLKKKNYDRAIKIYQKALDLSKEVKLINFIGTVSGNIGSTYLKEYQQSSKSSSNLIAKAEKYLKKAVRICDSIGFLAPKIEFSESLIEVYAIKKDYLNAFELQRQTYIAQDSLNSLKSKKEIAQLEFKRDKEIRENQLTIKEKELKINQLSNQKKLLILIFIISILIILIIVGWKVYHTRIRKHKSQMSEIKQLQSHEFRGPIASMKGISKIMEQRIKEGKSIEDLITSVHDLSEKMDNIVKRIIEKSNQK